MVSKHDLAARYTRYSAEELHQLIVAGADNLTPEAWQALQDELERRPEIASAPAVSRDEDGRLRRASPSHPLVPRGGWLTLFQIWVWLTSARAAFRLSEDIPGAVSLFSLINGAMIALNLWGLYSIASRHPSAKRYWIVYLVGLAALNVLVGAMTGAIKSAVVGSLACYAWAQYWYRSERVRATFR